MRKHSCVNLKDRAVAFGALAYLLAESVPSATFSERMENSERNSRIFTLSIPVSEKLNAQEKKSLEKLIENADDMLRVDASGKTTYTFYLDV